MSAAGEVETVILVRSLARDNYGDPGFGNPTSTAIDGVLVAPGASTEAAGSAGTVTTTWELYLPPSAPVPAPTDQMVVRGRRCEVVGAPQVWGSVGTVVTARQVTG